MVGNNKGKNITQIIVCIAVDTGWAPSEQSRTSRLDLAQAKATIRTTSSTGLSQASSHLSL